MPHHVKLTIVVAILAVFVSRPVKAAETTTAIQPTPSTTPLPTPTIHQHAAATADHHIQHTVPAQHHGLVGQIHQHSHILHSTVSAVQANLSQANLSNTQQHGSQTSVASAGWSGLTSARHIESPHTHVPLSSVTQHLAGQSPALVRLHNLPATIHSTLYGAGVLPIHIVTNPQANTIGHHHVQGALVGATQGEQQSSQLQHHSGIEHHSSVEPATGTTATPHQGHTTENHVAAKAGDQAGQSHHSNDNHSSNDGQTGVTSNPHSQSHNQSQNHTQPENSQAQSIANHIPHSGTVFTNQLPANAHQAQSQMNAVLEHDYVSWTGGKSNSLTLQTVGTLLRDPHIKGSQAALLGVIADKLNGQYVNSHNKNPQYTYAQLAALISPSGGHAAHNMTNYYTNAMAQIVSITTANGSFPLYGASGKPEIANIKQGPVNDCYFLAAVETVIKHDPSAISKMITDNHNGNYTVHFPSGHVEHVKLTDGAVAEFTLNTGNGVWLSVLGMAEAQTRAGSNQIKNDTPMGNTIDLGLATQAMSLFTGTPYSAIRSTSSNWNVATITSVLNNAFANNQPIGVSSNDHALAIMGWNSSTGQVTILNPWGTTGTYTPESSSPQQHVSEQNGYFTISVGQMVSMFRQVTAPSALLSGTGASNTTASTSTGSVQHQSVLLHANVTTAGLSSAALNFNGAAGIPAVHTHQPAATGSVTAAAFSTRTLPALRVPVLPLPGASGVVETDTLPKAWATLPASSSPAVSREFVPQSDSQNHSAAISCKMADGSLFICNKNSVVVVSDFAVVQVKPGATAFLVQMDDELAVFNLCDTKCGDVKVIVSGSNHALVKQGHGMIITTKKLKDVNALNVPKYITLIDPSAPQAHGSLTTVTGLFSYPCLFANSAQIHEIRNSKVPEHVQLKNRFYKTCAAITAIRANRR